MQSRQASMASTLFYLFSLKSESIHFVNFYRKNVELYLLWMHVYVSIKNNQDMCNNFMHTWSYIHAVY